ncbi:PTS transporter subunit EIIC [Jeotgalibaca sp. MA1X17-3]|uniref:PTS sugar transporter subunit IIC n=1 Tax=Jeotgalibaca sp. MA1X17-3 TaxID=2908211 RepID=UPI001F198298|nr:PTS transporter subunit EIIC [Jeotgalibaca sp. MA1X17-3]UJF15561.1 PTS transporter subunit EIIC [Jeotgalibaca sp. MA1X17-3]
MKSFMDWLAEKFAPKMNEIFSRPWPAAISSAMQRIIPFILVGSLIFLYNVLRSFVSVLPDLSALIDYSFGLIAIIVAFTMANQVMEELKHREYGNSAGLTAISVLFMATVPFVENDSLANFLGLVGPSGIAIGMIVGIFVGAVFHNWAKLKFLKDSGLPDFFKGWINVVIPIVISLGISMILVYVFNINITQAILSIFVPLESIAQTLPGFILLCFIPAFFYTMGISSWLFSAITSPIYLSAIQRNIDAVAQGLSPTEIVTNETIFTLAFITMGGMGATLGLNLLMMRSKSRRLKTLGKIFIVPSIFNINEPIMFGAPVVFNPLLMLPVWINAVIGPIYVWILMSIGLLNIPSELVWVGQIPGPFSSVMVTEDLRALLWWAILLVIYLVIWYPFFKVYEKEVLIEEAEENLDS